MELPNATDIELQLALLNAISQCADGTAVAEEIRPVVEKALSLHIPIDQKEDWTNSTAWALINMRDQKRWLHSPYYEQGTKGVSLESQMWVKTNRPGANPVQRIWKISDLGAQIVINGPPPVATPIRKKQAKEDHARQMMYEYYKGHRTELPEKIKDQSVFILELLMKGCPAEEAFSMAVKKMA